MRRISESAKSFQPNSIAHVAPINIAGRLELFVDDYLIAALDNATHCFHAPIKMPLSEKPLTGVYSTVIKDGDLFRAYSRQQKPAFTGDQGDGNSGECTCYFESRDGIEWDQPDLGVFDPARCGGLRNVVLNEPPFPHNFSPFLDTRPGVKSNERFKGLAGLHKDGLFAFASPDGIHWHKMQDTPVFCYTPDVHGLWAFDSQNVAFFSEAEQCYVLYFRHMKTSHEPLRTIGRATSKDFLEWHDESTTFKTPNLPGEHLYTSQTHPYIRAPHIYLALPTRFALGMVQGRPVEGNIGSTDVLFMSTRAGADHYNRLFKEAFIRPGLDPANWESRANYTALNVVPTSSTEMSIYNRGGHRYVMRTDGFASINTLFDDGEMITHPLTYAGDTLSLNVSTSVVGSVRVELQDVDGTPLPGFTLADCDPVTDDNIECHVIWRGSDVRQHAGRPVKIRFVMRDADLYSMQFLRG